MSDNDLVALRIEGIKCTVELGPPGVGSTEAIDKNKYPEHPA